MAAPRPAAMRVAVAPRALYARDEPDSAATLVEEPWADPEAAKPTKSALNMFQLLTLCAVRIVEPIAFTQIFPYVNDMMASFHLTDDASKMGFYSGSVESIFAVAQLFSIYQWARLSDRIGRKPVILMGVVGLAITTFLFGLSGTLVETLGARFLSGLFSGNVAVMHSVLGELTDSSNQAVAFPIYGLVWPFGAIIGPLLGGTFSHPAENFPSVFDNALFRRFPFLLPCLIAAVTALGGCVVGYYKLEETLPSKCRAHSDYIPLSSKEKADDARSSSDTSRSSLSDSPSPSPAPTAPVTMRSLLALPIIRALCLSGMALAFLNTGFDVLFVLFCYSPVALGGLALAPAQIGYILSLSGVCSIAIQLFIMPALLRSFDLVRMYGVCMAIWPAAFALMPALNVLARLGPPLASVVPMGATEAVGAVVNATVDGLSGVEGELMDGARRFAREIAHTALEASGAVHEGVAAAAPAKLGLPVWLGIAVILFLARSACIAYSLSMILVKENAPSPAALGTTNGLAQATMCFARAFSPAFVSSLYALSVDNGLLGGYLWVALMVAISLAGSRITRTIERETRGKRGAGGKHGHAHDVVGGFE